MHVSAQFDDRLRELWTAALRQESDPWPFYTYSWHEAWAKHIGISGTLSVFADSATSVIIPLAIHGDTAQFTGGAEIADYLDAIGPDTGKASAWRQTILELQKRGVTSLLLRNIPGSSASLAFFRKVASARIEEEDSTPLLTLPSSEDLYIATLPRKERHEMRRKIRRFEEQHPGATLHTSSEPDMPLLLTFMRNNPEKAEFLTPAMEAFFSHLSEAVGRALIQCTLVLDSTPIASALAFRQGSSLLLYNSGYDPAYIGSGWYLKTKLISWAIQEGYTTINFLQGKERYKYELGAIDAPVYRVSMTLHR